MKLTLESLSMYCAEVGKCLHWSGGVNGQGYPQANIDGKVWLVRRYVFTELLGGTLKRQQPVVSRCGSRLCVSPACIRAATHGTVLADAYRNGSRDPAREYGWRFKVAQSNGMCTVGWEVVKELRSRPGDVSHAELAREFGIHEKTVSKIRNRITWRTDVQGASVFTWRPGR